LRVTMNSAFILEASSGLAYSHKMFSLSTSLFRRLHSSPCLLKGHNRWSKVKNIKAPNDMLRAKQISALQHQMLGRITKTKVTDPDQDRGLLKLFENGVKLGLSKVKVQELITSCSKLVVHETIVKLELQPLSIIVTSLTMNNIDYKDNMKLIKKFSVFNGMSKQYGSLNTLLTDEIFDQKVMASVKKTEFFDEDAAMTVAVEVDAEEVEFDEYNDEWLFISSGNQKDRFRSNLEKQNLDVISSDVVFVPYMPLELSPEELQKAENLCENLASTPSVTGVYPNFIRN
jgi:transcriptional/translational regulatory protein YebC/TACO1